MRINFWLLFSIRYFPSNFTFILSPFHILSTNLREIEVLLVVNLAIPSDDFMAGVEPLSRTYTRIRRPAVRGKTPTRRHIDLGNTDLYQDPPFNLDSREVIVIYKHAWKPESK